MNKIKQYCRYCCEAHLIDEDTVYCNVKDAILNDAMVKRLNNCKDFASCGFDVYDPNKNYKPRQNKEKNYEQIKLF